ncbi:MAG: hypothetical protein Q9218_004076 [Villophora microphyllina]
MRTHFLEEGINSSQEELLAPRPSRISFSSSIFGMQSPEPDLERADGALKVPQNPFAPTSPTGKPADAPKRRASKQQSQNRHSQQRPLGRLAPPHHDPNAIPPKLVKLRTVIGISTPDSIASSSSSPLTRPGPNLGIYARIIKEEQNARYQFYFAASVINISYFGQIVVAAALTALGASSSSHVAITVLAAVNTVIAGILTYLKGQGLPNRLRQYWNGLRKCREFIEEKERECAAEGWGDDGEKGMDVEHEIEVIIKMYHDVRQTAEDNIPDTYLPMQGNSANILNRFQPGKGSAAATGDDKAHLSGSGSVRYPEDDEIDERSDAEHSAAESGDESPAPKTKPVPESPASPTIPPAPAPTPAPAMMSPQAQGNGSATK